MNIKNFCYYSKLFLHPLSLCFLLLSIWSCSHLKSGHYHKLTKGESLDSIAIYYNISKQDLLAHNINKDFNAGDLVFIPSKQGVRYWGGVVGDKDLSEVALKGKFLWPVPSIRKVSSKFGHRWGRQHEGIDIAGPIGTHFLASQSGVVVYSGSRIGGYGKMIIISHPGGMYSVYAHANRILVKKGQKVFRGQVIGQIGRTGRVTGPHLHFEIRKDDKAINPKHLLVFN